MELRVIAPRKKAPNKYDLDETYEIPVKVLKIHKENKNGRIIPITIERLDFKTGELITSNAITFQGSVELYESMNLELPFYTDCIVYKNGKFVNFKVIGIYNVGFWEKMNDVPEILNNDEEELNKIFHMHYEELNNWLTK